MKATTVRYCLAFSLILYSFLCSFQQSDEKGVPGGDLPSKNGLEAGKPAI